MTTNHLNRDALVVGICQYDDLSMSAQLETLAKQAARLFETQRGFKVRPSSRMGHRFIVAHHVEE